MPTFPEPYWRDSVEFESFEPLEEDIEADAVVVGGGITGITTAYLLQKEGMNVVILEASNILNGTTGHTTAKLTAQHDVIYDEFISHLGKEKARLYYEANMDAKKFVQDTIEEHGIDCDFKEQEAIIYATSQQSLANLENEWNAYKKLGIDSDFVDSIPVDIEDVKGALVMKNQAQFHPLKYLKHLVDDFLQRGGKIYEKTTAVDILEEARPRVMTRNGKKATCHYVISCSHFPFYDFKGAYFSRMYADRSYVIGIKANKEYPGGMYLSADQPTRSLRSATINGEEMIIVGGEGHKTGHATNTMKHYEALQQFANQTFGIKEFLYRWSAQDLTTLDKVPYIGHITSNDPSILVATGFRKWGMTTSTVASLLMSDMILKKDNPYMELYDPARFNADPSVRKFVSQNLDVAGHFVKGKVGLKSKAIDDIQEGEGAVVKIDGNRAGAYKDQNGKLYVVDTTCTHMGCELEWNNGEHTWDCPCHGSRFSIEGEVVEGPAETPLPKIDVD
ncbi:FAD-dependent oxidoreductase [Salinibacillus xinjiangensis]|uniref:FAD-dependent oxidoreductase n=1 Tax=Salinibacillus xinjiangensis TaxID=1229268 RepID=A0A6G1X667_9BACI|nr:FAD-dependent oxidoreductase [Salinibacillus xinjiangensis]MRG86308.1 FAD-dependent oxidoreductase [Salinibacillus xinjiangensis]